MERQSDFVPENAARQPVSPEVMPFEEYAEHCPHQVPYVFEIERRGKKIVYFGTPHSADPENPIFGQIEAKFHEATPQIVFVEGMETSDEEMRRRIIAEAQTTDRETLIKRHGEPSFTMKLALEAGIEVDSPEPDPASEIKFLEVDRKHSREAIFAYYLYRSAEQYYRIKSPHSIEEYLAPVIDRFQQQSQWENFDYSIDHLKQIGGHFWGERGDLSKRDKRRATPMPGGSVATTEVNQVARQSSYFRDVFIMRRIIEAMSKHDRLFIVYGASHAYMQEPGLRKIFEETEPQQVPES